MPMTIIEFLFLGLCCGVISLTLTKGTIFESLRMATLKRSLFFGELLMCPYCTSHWVAMGAMLVFHPEMITSSFLVFNYLATWFALVALSAMTAGSIQKLLAPAAK